METQMSPKRRFLSAIMGGVVDRIPVGNVVSIVTVDLMEIAGAWFPEAHVNAAAMAELAETGQEVLGYDTVMPVFSVIQEAAALGCEVDWGDPRIMPGVKTHPFAETDELCIPDSWMETPAIQVVLDALNMLRKSKGDRIVVVGKVMGPWSLSYHMMGVEEFLVSTLLNQDKANRSLEVLREVTVAFAQAQIRAGADIICLADHITGGMVSPIMYRDILLPIHQEITNRIGSPIVLHCCGNTTDRLKYFAESGIDCYHFESQVKIDDAISAAEGKMRLMGNINGPQLLLSAEPDDVAEACYRVIEGGIHILSPECAVPLTTPLGNLKTLVKVAEDIYHKPKLH